VLPHSRIYEAAALYDLAFSYRDYGQETGFLRELYRRRRGRAAGSFLELAAGPAQHALAMLAAGLDAVALDLAPEMASYAHRLAAARGLSLPYLTADMASFSAPRRFDLVACMLCSASYLLTDDAVRSHLACVREALIDDGMYVLELSHPSELSGTRLSKEVWAVTDARGTLDVAWRGDPATAVGGIWQSDAELVYRPSDGSAPITVAASARQRGFRLDELLRLAEQSGLEVEATLGAFDEDVTLESPHANRMIVVVRRRAGSPVKASNHQRGVVPAESE
jgi:hypothetical protein